MASSQTTKRAQHSAHLATPDGVCYLYLTCFDGVYLNVCRAEVKCCNKNRWRRILRAFTRFKFRAHTRIWMPARQLAAAHWRDIIYIYIWTAGTKQAHDGSCCADGAAASMLFAIFISHHKTPANNRRITSYTDISPYSIWQYITINHAKYQSTRGYIKCKRRWCYRVKRVSIYVFRRRKWAVDARCAYLRYCAIGDRKIWRRWRGSINNYYV